MDFVFYPENTGEDCLILELKVNGTPLEAICQIKEKETKKHACAVEVLREKSAKI